MAITIPIGKIKPEVYRLIETARESLRLSIDEIRTGITFGDIGDVIQKYVQEQGRNNHLHNKNY